MIIHFFYDYSMPTNEREWTVVRANGKTSHGAMFLRELRGIYGKLNRGVNAEHYPQEFVYLIDSPHVSVYWVDDTQRKK